MDAMIKLFGMAIVGALNGFSIIFNTPRLINSIFAGKRYHFMTYPILLVGVISLLSLIKAGLRPVMGQGEILWGTVFSICFFTAFFAGLMSWARQLLENSGTWLAWYPGMGWKNPEGGFSPMPWAYLLRPFGLMKGQQRNSAIPIPNSAAPIPTARIPFAHGRANVGEIVLRGTQVFDGYDYAEHVAKNNEDLSMNLHVGVVPLPYPAEPQHFMIAGKTGAGKTQVINAFLSMVRLRRQSCIIADPAGGYLARFGIEDFDSVLNPFDMRTLNWSPFAEIRADYDFARIAKAAIPDADGNSQEWNFYAQTLLAETMKAMHGQGLKSTKRLLYYVNSAEQDELKDLLLGSPAEILTSPSNSKMLNNVRSIISIYLSSWVYLQDEGDFSIRDFVSSSDELGGRWLFLTYTDAQMALLKYMVATWMELAIVEGLSLTESNTRRFFYVLDELDSLGKITSLRAGLTKLRKYGGVCISGIQTIAQLRTTYGRDEAQTLLSCMSTKLALPQGDNETADYMSNELGEQEIEREQSSQGTSQKMGELAPHNSTNTSKHRQVQKAVLPAQLTGLPDLQGYLKISGSNVLQVVVPYRKYDDRNSPFVERKL